MYSLLLLALPLLAAAEAVYRPALEVRQSTVQEVCGSGAVDCGDGWCCFGGNTCASELGSMVEKQCSTLTIVTFPYQSEAAQTLSFPSEAASSLGPALSSATSDLAGISAELASLSSAFGTMRTTLPQYPTITGPRSGGDTTSSTQPTSGGDAGDAAAGLRALGLAMIAGTEAVWVVAGLAGGA